MELRAPQVLQTAQEARLQRCLMQLDQGFNFRVDPVDATRKISRT